MIEDYESINNMTEKQAAEVLENMRVRFMGGRASGKTRLIFSYNVAIQKAISKLKSNGWIPVETIDMTEEEIKEEAELYGIDVIDKDDFWRYTCPLPDDGDEVLITTPFGVCLDIFHDDEGCWFEDHPDRGDVLAWMPLPKPYEKEGESDADR